MTAPSWGPWFGDVSADGDGAQNAFGNQVGHDLIQQSIRFVRGQPAMYLGSAEIADRLRCYVAARNHDQIVKALAAEHAVVLAGPSGCGRETTAIAAIHRLRPGIRIRKFSPDAEDAEELAAKGEGYLVDTMDGGDRLGHCADAVRASGGFLVVRADAEAEPPAGIAHLSSIVVEPPDPLEVYRRRVTEKGFGDWWHWDRATELLKGAMPVHARRLADLVASIAPAGGDLADRRAEILHAYQGWRGELCAWFDRNPEPHDRALLVAAAALEPVAETDVYTVASSLVRRLDVTMNGAGLAWCPVTQLRDLLKAYDDDRGRIVFRRHGFARSVLRHALADFPLAQPELLAWLAALPTGEGVPVRSRIPLAETFADLAAELGAAEIIIETARTWGAGGLADHAFTALSRTCLHPRVGGRVRTALYEWSRAERTPQTLKLVIARVCEPLGQTYPSIALTRLKHLATYGNPQVLGEVADTARELVRSGHHAEVIRAALGWSAESNEERLSPQARRRRRFAGAVLFLDLARPLAETGVPELLAGADPIRYAPGWRAALDAAGFPTGRNIPVDDVVYRWLDAALGHPYVRDGITGLFVAAAWPSSARATLSASASPYEPAPAGPAAAEIMIELVRRWAAADRTDPIRRQVKEAIVIPLTRPWWLRSVKRAYVYARILVRQVVKRLQGGPGTAQ